MWDCPLTLLLLPQSITQWGEWWNCKKMPRSCSSIFSQFFFNRDAQNVCSGDVKSSELPFCMFPACQSRCSLRNSLRCQQNTFDVCSSFPHFGPMFPTCSSHTVMNNICKYYSIYVSLHFTLSEYNYWLVLIPTIFIFPDFFLKLQFIYFEKTALFVKLAEGNQGIYSCKISK